jgi:ABC-type glycerol-3-phosphate transport system substrate-binding protein
MHRMYRRLLLLCLALALLAACGRFGPAPASSPTPDGPGTRPVTAEGPGTPGAPPTPPPGASSEPPGPVTLRLWLPPDFAPDINSASGRLLAEQLSAFEDRAAGTALEVRIKAASGQGGLLTSLITAANAAPGVLPHLIALRRDDLVTAAAAGLVTPLDGLVSADFLAGYYPFAQAMGRASGAWVGLPFAADARVVVYQTGTYATPPLTWEQVTTGTVVLPGAEPSALSLVSTYLSLGGILADTNGQLRLDADLLAQSLQHYRDLQTQGLLPLSTLDYADTFSTWQVFRERRAGLAVTSAERYLAEYFRVEGSAATLLPTDGSPRLALADGWCWAIVNTEPERHPLAAQLLAWLTAPEQHAAWTEAAMVLPTHTAALAGWQSQRLVPFVSDVLAHAQLQPPGQVLAVVGPALRQALADVLNNRATPFAAAALAAQAINTQ